ncbi:hypothetical protein DKT77_18500 [Meridianimarinicoccus roseus]|jgi:hypothetical protein|uniref:Uncharacterized protein n=1 Tax=Meridianimarinicoccus roseus TaxID=2072018 RepID=A0A2V2LFF0_9RHOB|nr:hypothetical protein [Meridianimarinicoccus roseus]PWR01149.1 hypothetical protein DKT77_18500 [Meridianimarinicoccus roseus]
MYQEQAQTQEPLRSGGITLMSFIAADVVLTVFLASALKSLGFGIVQAIAAAWLAGGFLTVAVVMTAALLAQAPAQRV